MDAALHHALLGLATGALAAASLRVASLAVPSGLARAISAFVFVGAGMVGEALLLGLVDLGGSPVALSLAAFATWAAARALLPEPEVRAGAELVSWWRDRSAAERAALGAGLGASAAWAAWQLRYPAIGFDTVHYHLPEIVLWVQEGSPGTVLDVLPGLPVGNYPITNEVLLAWQHGLAQGFAPLTLWPWALLLLTAVAGWAGLRALGVRVIPAAVACTALCLAPPIVAWQSNGGMTDPPALAWLVACAALCALARERPALLAPALVAAGLAVGTKTTAAPMALLVLALGFWSVRARLGALRVPLALALGAAVLVGGVWYLRNLFSHGSPFWPIVAAPWGDPVPPSVEAVDTSFLDRPRATIDAIGDAYLERFAGGLLLVIGGIVAPVFSRERRVLAAAGATLFGALVWARAPVTGLSEVPGLEETTFSTTRYLLPVLAAGTLALALAASGRGRLAPGALLVLATAGWLNAVQTFDLGFPTAPGASTPVAGALLGAAAALALGWATGRVRLPAWRPPAPAAGALLAALLGASLAIASNGYVDRHAGTVSLLTAGVTDWFQDQPGYHESERPIATTPAYIAPLAGDELEHPLRALRQSDDCGEVRAQLEDGYVVAYRSPLGGAPPADVPRCLAGVEPAYRDPIFLVYPPG